MAPRFLSIVLCAIVLAGCGRETAAPAPKAQAVPAVVITVTATDVPNVAEFVGETESSQEVEIRARVEGFL
jgi:membrane fusion protein, multidrug efflux system